MSLSGWRMPVVRYRSAAKKTAFRHLAEINSFCPLYNRWASEGYIERRIPYTLPLLPKDREREETTIQVWWNQH